MARALLLPLKLLSAPLLALLSPVGLLLSLRLDTSCLSSRARHLMTVCGGW